MRDILPELERGYAQDMPLALATVVQTWGSAPRRVGSKMVVTAEGKFSGSVSGGCVENAVIEAAQEVIRTSRPGLLHFGVADETAWEVGLACGGSIEVFVNPLDLSLFPSLRAAWTAETQSVLVTVIRGSEHLVGRELLVGEDGMALGNLGNHRQTKAVDLARGVLQEGVSRRLMLDEETEVFLEYIAPPPVLVAVGGTHITAALAPLAKAMGYRTTVIDPRSAWGSEDRFPHVDRLIQAWPQDAFSQLQLTRSTAVAMLTHDPKIDDPALKIALDSPAFYVGALGSRTTHAKRRERLLQEGVSSEQLARLQAPIGLDIGAETPEEIALAIMAEVVKAYRTRNGVHVRQEAHAASTQNG